MRRMLPLVVAAPALAWGLTAGCTLLVDTDGLSGSLDASARPGDAAADASSSLVPDARADAAEAGSGGEAGAPCSAPKPGPRMIHVGTFCIDATEVTQTHYAAFMAAKMGQPGVQPASCAWNADITPTIAITPGSSLPVTGVDFCDARLYCEWAGKRLCGARSGGPLGTSEADTENATRDEWYAACSNNGDGLHEYPYGSAYVASACSGENATRVAPVGSLATCTGGIPGLLDMSGNAWEWQDACEPSDGGAQNDRCLLRGGGVGASLYQLRCLGRNALPYRRNGTFGSVGFRCCSDAAED
jgi:formylglycine-generating enzyme required for sulfatase activity